MDGEYVERVINSESVLKLGGEVASNSADNTEDDRWPNRHITWGRSNSDQSRNAARAKAYSWKFTLDAVIQEDPSESTCTCCEVGDDASGNSTQVSTESATTVEAKPAHPQEDSSDYDVGDIVGAVGKTMEITVSTSLAEHERVCKSRSAGRDMDWSSSCKVKTSQFEHPTCRVPCPTCNWVVYERGPDEYEDDTRKHAASISCSANGQGRSNMKPSANFFFSFLCGKGYQTDKIWGYSRNGGEHALVDGE